MIVTAWVKKTGKANPIPSLTTKVTNKKKWKEGQKETEKQKGVKPKPPPKSGLGPTLSTALFLPTMKQMTQPMLTKRSTMTPQREIHCTKTQG